MTNYKPGQNVGLSKCAMYFHVSIFLCIMLTTYAEIELILFTGGKKPINGPSDMSNETVL